VLSLLSVPGLLIRAGPGSYKSESDRARTGPKNRASGRAFVLRAFCISIDKAARDTFINLTFSIEIIKTLNKNNIKGSFGMVLWTALALAHREALPNGKKTTSRREPSKSQSYFRVGSQNTKNVASTGSSYILHTPFKTNTRETVLAKELQNASNSSRETKELEKPEPKLFI
jgi:hypothetical protein